MAKMRWDRAGRTNRIGWAGRNCGFCVLYIPGGRPLWASLMYIGKDHGKEVVWLDTILERNVVRGTVQNCVFERFESSYIVERLAMVSLLSRSYSTHGGNPELHLGVNTNATYHSTQSLYPIVAVDSFHSSSPNSRPMRPLLYEVLPPSFTRGFTHDFLPSGPVTSLVVAPIPALLH